MNIILIVLLSLVVAMYFTYIDYKGKYKKSIFFKLCATLLIIVASFLCFINSNQNVEQYFKFIFIGLSFGFLGDLFLALKKIYPKKEILFVVGLVSFLIGHICYIKAFTLVNPINTYDFIFTIIYLFFSYYIFNKSKIDFKNIKYGVGLYCCVISFMLSKATSVLMLSNEILFATIIFIGALLFVLSDIFLSFSIFGKKNNAVFSLYCHLLYFPAQVLIVLSILIVNI